ncbi:MAG: helix-turn-helix transcriptional regulator [Cyanobacteria bacterium SZAS TMP-1]|nr:helix-turn-helix transcriptional regulator [Cyanobacteria bacterium SZAS TMP-1]
MQDSSSVEPALCPINSVLDVISAKWTVEILRELALGSMRTRAFLRVIPGISMKSLLQRLKALQDAGMISRTAFGEKSLRVEYSITPRGQRVLAIYSELLDLASEMMEVSCCCSITGACANEISCPNRAPQSGAQ